MNKDFYLINSELLSSSIHASLEDNLSLNELQKLFKGEFTSINFPINFRQEHGKKESDLLDTGTIYILLISEKVRNILLRNKISGWKTYEVKVFDKNNKEITGYHGLSITGKCAPTYFNEEKIIKKQLTENAPLSSFYKGLFFDIGNWDGSDIFMPTDSYYIIITEKVYNILSQAKLTNFKFENLIHVESLKFDH